MLDLLLFSVEITVTEFHNFFIIWLPTLKSFGSRIRYTTLSNKQRKMTNWKKTPER